jgi:hypothetical protein
MSHITVAASAKAFEQMFALARDNLNLKKSDNGSSFGLFTWQYDIQMHLQGGTIQLNNDDSVEIKHLGVVWDKLQFKICFNLPGFCVGGGCIISGPAGCIVSLPQFCIGGPICLPLDLSGLVSEIDDIKANLKPLYWIDPTRPPNISDLAAELMNKSNEWRVFLDPLRVDVLPVDVLATISNILRQVFEQAIMDTYPWVPGWGWSLLWPLLGPLLDLLEKILGIAENIQNWVEDLLNNTFNLVAVVETLVAQYFAAQYPLFKFEDPYPILPATSNLIPVKIPIRNLAAHVDAQEMTVTADIGA